MAESCRVATGGRAATYSTASTWMYALPPDVSTDANKLCQTSTLRFLPPTYKEHMTPRLMPQGSASAWEIDLILIIYNTLIVVALINNYFLRLSKNMSQCANNFASIIKVHYFLVRTVRKGSKPLPWTNNFHESTEILVSSHVQYYFCTKQLLKFTQLKTANPCNEWSKVPSFVRKLSTRMKK